MEGVGQQACEAQRGNAAFERPPNHMSSYLTCESVSNTLHRPITGHGAQIKVWRGKKRRQIWRKKSDMGENRVTFIVKEGFS